MNLLIPALLTALSSMPAPAALPRISASSPVPTAGPVRPETAQRVDPAGRGVWPVGSAEAPPEVVHGFAPPPTPYAAGHRGVDLAALAGTPVRAVLGGQVLFAGSIAGKGVVVVGHGDTRTTYEPVTPLVRVGDRVARGTTIGVLRPGGHCMPGSCLHWGWLRGDTYLDPLELVGATAPVRLKPWTGLPAA